MSDPEGRSTLFRWLRDREAFIQRFVLAEVLGPPRARSLLHRNLGVVPRDPTPATPVPQTSRAMEPHAMPVKPQGMAPTTGSKDRG